MISLDALLEAAALLPADSLPTDAADWLADAIARGVRVSPQLAALVMHSSGTSPDQVRQLVARQQRRQQLIAIVRAGQAASRRLDAAQLRVERATDQLRQVTADVEQAVHAGEQARSQLIDPALLSDHQAQRLACSQATLDHVHQLLHDTLERHRILRLRVTSIRDQFDAASRRPGGAVAAHPTRQHLEQLSADHAAEQTQLTSLRAAVADARRAHDDLLAELIDGADR